MFFILITLAKHTYSNTQKDSFFVLNANNMDPFGITTLT